MEGKNNTGSSPMITIHRAENRGAKEYGWLSTRHSFSFADWYDPSRMGFGALRVLNDDTVTGGHGFGMHGHDNMEIITIVITGTLNHKDSMGHASSVTAGEVQVMSAGTGIRHSEFNHGAHDLKLFQIWIVPNMPNVVPRYDQRAFPDRGLGEVLLIAPFGYTEALNIHQDAYISRLTLDVDHPLDYTLKKSGHGVYFFIVDGSVMIAGESLDARDSLGVENIDCVTLSTNRRSVVLAFEVPMY